MPEFHVGPAGAIPRPRLAAPPAPAAPPPTPPVQAIQAIEAVAKERALGAPDVDSPAPRATPPPRNDGYRQRFQRGWVYWTPRTGAHWIRGAIFEKFSELKGEQGFLGFPLSDETPAPDGVGRFTHFEGGSIYWMPDTGAHEVHGAIRELWAKSGWELGRLGYPTSDEYDGPGGGRRSDFQHGTIVWDPKAGPRIERRSAQAPPPAAVPTVARAKPMPADAAPANAVPAVVAGVVVAGVVRIDFEGARAATSPWSEPASLVAGDVVRFDFEGARASAAPWTTPSPYHSAAPLRVDFEGSRSAQP